MTITPDRERDIAIVRELAARVAGIAALPVQEEKRQLWTRLNGLKAERPMVMIDQVCWNEMNVDDELTLQCADGELRDYECGLRMTLYRWRHFPVDYVVDGSVGVPRAVGGMGLGVSAKDEVAVSDPTNSVVGHHYDNQFQTEADLEKIKEPEVTYNVEETERRLAVAHEIFDGILDVKLVGAGPPSLAVWDRIAEWMSVEGALYALVDQPEFVHRLVQRICDCYGILLDQLEEQGLLCGTQDWIHCTGAYTTELPAEGYNPEKPRVKDLWAMGMAQMFATVSPAMFKEFEVDHVAPLFARFGLGYYGCCEPLHGMMDAVREIPNVRKVSMSPWVDKERGAAGIGKDYVYSCKPSPALVATTRFDADAVRRDLSETLEICNNNGCNVEFILKDISTVNYEPQRLTDWANIAMDIVQQA